MESFLASISRSNSEIFLSFSIPRLQLLQKRPRFFLPLPSMSTHDFPLPPFASARVLAAARLLPPLYPSPSSPSSSPPPSPLPTLFIASYPKSGTTWMQAVIFHILNARALPLDHISDYSPFYENEKTWEWGEREGEGEGEGGRGEVKKKYNENHRRLSYRVFNTHLVPDMLPKGENVKYIYVVRSGRDVVTSFYYHLKNQIGEGGIDPSIPFPEFLNDWCDGKVMYGCWLSHVEIWMEAFRASPSPSPFLLVRYEDLKADLRTELTRIATFLDAPLSPERLSALSDILSFGGMKSQLDLYQPVSVRWREGYSFLRRGEVGGKAFGEGEWEERFCAMVREKYPFGVPGDIAALGVL